MLPCTYIRVYFFFCQTTSNRASCHGRVLASSGGNLPVVLTAFHARRGCSLYFVLYCIIDVSADTITLCGRQTILIFGSYDLLKVIVPGLLAENRGAPVSQPFLGYASGKKAPEGVM